MPFLKHTGLMRAAVYSCFAAVLSAIFLAATAFGVSAQTGAAPARVADHIFHTKARQVILMDAASGAVLFQQDADKLIPPASMSKLMTLAVVFKGLKAGAIKPSDEFLMSEHAWRTGGAPSRTSAMMVPVNTKVSVAELLKGVIIESGNDASIALGEGIAGSERAFAEELEREARRIGMPNSTFRNATGLPNPEHLMTTRELAVVARHIIRTYPDYYPMFAEKQFNYRTHKFINRNPLLYLDIGADGLKTGHTKEAGYCLVGSAMQNGRRLIGVMAGLSTDAERREEGRRLFEWGFRVFGEFKLYEAGEIIGRANVWGGQSLSVPLTADGPAMIILPKFPANQRLRAEIQYTGPIRAPISKGDQIATLRVTSSNDATAEIPLFAAEDVAASGFLKRGLHSLYYLVRRSIRL